MIIVRYGLVWYRYCTVRRWERFKELVRTVWTYNAVRTVRTCILDFVDSKTIPSMRATDSKLCMKRIRVVKRSIFIYSLYIPNRTGTVPLESYVS